MSNLPLVPSAGIDPSRSVDERLCTADCRSSGLDSALPFKARIDASLLIAVL